MGGEEESNVKASKTVLLFLTVLLLGGYIWFVERNKLSPAEQKAVDRQAFDLSMDRVDRIGIRTASLDVEMVHDGSRWMLVEPKGARASQPIVQQLLARFRSLNRGEFITPADMRSRSLTLADFGLEIPQLMLTLGVKDERRLYSVGSPNPLGTSLYVKEESSQNVMLVSSDLLEIVPPDVFLFRDSELFPVAPSEVRELALGSENGTVRLQREGEFWMMINPVRAVANSAKVEELLLKLGQSRIEDVVNRPGTESLQAFQGGGNIEFIRLWSNTQSIPIELQIGGSVPGDLHRNFARILGQEGLVEVSKGLQVLAQTSASALRDRTVLSLSPEEVHLIEISDAETEIVLSKKEDGWVMQEPLDLPASSAKIQQVIGHWKRAIVEEFLPLEGEAPAESIGKVTFRGEAEGSEEVFTLFKKSTPPGRAFAQKAEASEWLQVVPDVVKFIPQDPLAYVSKNIISFDPHRAVRLSVHHQTTTLNVVRADASSPWETSTDSVSVDQRAVQSSLNQLRSLSADQVIPFTSEMTETPETRISIGLGGENPENFTLAISDTEVWIQGREVAYRVASSASESIVNTLLRAAESNQGEPGAEERP